jgi:deazaflavin-dependent oxidoreductase (nitroreductase family)
VNDWDEMVVRQFWAGEPRLGDTFDRDQVLLLGTTGARTGEPRLTPLAYTPTDEDGDLFVVVASGADGEPDWLHNLRKSGTASVRRYVGDEVETFTVTATETDGTERDELLDLVRRHIPLYADDDGRTERFPVILLRRER